MIYPSYDKLYWLSDPDKGVEIFGPLRDHSEGYYHLHDDECSCPRDKYAGAESMRMGCLDTIPDVVALLFKGKEWNGDLNDYPYFRGTLKVFPCVGLPEEVPPAVHEIFERVVRLSQTLFVAKDAKASLEDRVWEHPRKAAMIAAEDSLCKALAELRSEYQAMLDERLEGIPAEQILAWLKDEVDEIVKDQVSYIRGPLDGPPSHA